MKAEKSSPMAVSPTPKAALIWSLLPRTMYWSIPSTNRVRPTTHMGQLLITDATRRGARPGPDRRPGRQTVVSGACAVPTTARAHDRPRRPVVRRSLPFPAYDPGVYPAGRAIDFISRKPSRPSGPNSRPTPDSL